MATVVENLAAGVSERGVKIVYGAKETIDGQEIMPVALVSYGFGGGNGPGDTGAGGGGGGVAVPVGAYYSIEGQLRFRPNPLALLVVSIPVIFALGRALARIARAAK